MKESRQLPRWETKKKVRVWMPQTEDIDHCIVEDINLKGMRVSFNKPLPPQQSLQMAFSIGDYLGPINIEARVPWEREDQGRFIYGLSFTKISDQDKSRIEKYLNTMFYDQLKDKWWAV